MNLTGLEPNWTELGASAVTRLEYSVEPQKFWLQRNTMAMGKLWWICQDLGLMVILNVGSWHFDDHQMFFGCFW